jgi:hypothetical protein
MRVFLILTPELGIHFPNSGLPKDVIARKDNIAQDCNYSKIPVHLAPEFNKRYTSFLGRMDNLFHDLGKSQPQVMKCVTAVLTGSFWKYYRSPRNSAADPFSGPCGDYSNQASLAFRQRVESFYSQKEFNEPTAASANRWKTRTLEEVNRRWFYQFSEDVFRNRSRGAVQRKSAQLSVLDMELYTLEADPGVAYSNFLQMLSGGHADFSRLSALIDQASIRQTAIQSSASDSSAAFPFIHWTAMGGFRMLAEPEKQFLVLKSLLLLGGQKGGILLDESEWFSFSAQFQNRMEMITRLLLHANFRLTSRVIYLSPHLWSDGSELLTELTGKVGYQLRVIASIDRLMHESHESSAQLLIVDPNFILTREVVQKLCAWAAAGRVLVMPRSQLYTEAGRIELEQILIRTNKIEVDLGMPYRLHAMSEGKLVIYDLPRSSAPREDQSASIKTFLSAILSIAEVESFCSLNDHRLSVIAFDHLADSTEFRGPVSAARDEVALFILNGSRDPVVADILFPDEVLISDLGARLSGLDSALGVEKDRNKSNRFSLEVPPYAVLPLSVEGMDVNRIHRIQERQIAALNAEATRASAMSAALSELTGLSTTESFGDLWS